MATSKVFLVACLFGLLAGAALAAERGGSYYADDSDDLSSKYRPRPAKPYRPHSEDGYSGKGGRYYNGPPSEHYGGHEHYSGRERYGGEPEGQYNGGKYGHGDDAKAYVFDLSVVGVALAPPPPLNVTDNLIRIIDLYYGGATGTKVATGYASGVILEALAGVKSVANVLWNIEFTAGKLRGSKLVASGKIVWDLVTRTVNDEFIIVGGSGALLGAQGRIVTSGVEFNPTKASFKILVPPVPRLGYGHGGEREYSGYGVEEPEEGYYGPY